MSERLRPAGEEEGERILRSWRRGKLMKSPQVLEMEDGTVEARAILIVRGYRHRTHLPVTFPHELVDQAIELQANQEVEVTGDLHIKHVYTSEGARRTRAHLYALAMRLCPTEAQMQD